MKLRKRIEITKRGYELLDLTCFDVKKVQNRAIELVQAGFFVIILGKSEHPEVRAISANAQKYAPCKDNICVAQSLDNLTH